MNYYLICEGPSPLRSSCRLLRTQLRRRAAGKIPGVVYHNPQQPWLFRPAPVWWRGVELDGLPGSVVSLYREFCAAGYTDKAIASELYLVAADDDAEEEEEEEEDEGFEKERREAFEEDEDGEEEDDEEEEWQVSRRTASP